MKIFNNPNIQKVLGAYKSKMTKVEKSNKTMEAKDKIQISSKAKDFQVAMKAFKKLPDVRDEKINETQKAIGSGNYNPAAAEAVDKIFEGMNFDKKV